MLRKIIDPRLKHENKKTTLLSINVFLAQEALQLLCKVDIIRLFFGNRKVKKTIFCFVSPESLQYMTVCHRF